MGTSEGVRKGWLHRKRLTVPEIIQRNTMISVATDCWLWRGHRFPNGYGQYGRGRYAHRVAYEHFVGPIPEGVVLDHKCRQRSCCNPAHLEPVSQSENVQRGAQCRLSTHCPRGHERIPENQRIDKKGSKVCRLCNIENMRVYNARRKAANGGSNS